MSEGKEPGDMTAGELEEYLSALQNELEDLEEERAFVLGQTGLHVSAGAVKNYESQRERLRDRITEAERILQEKSQ